MHTAKTIFRYLGRSIAIFVECFFAILFLYWSAERLLSYIPAGEASKSIIIGGHPVYMTSNGVHSDFVLPINDGETNWGKDLCIEDDLAKDTSRHYLAFGWGHKEFFLKTKNWDDLTVGVALRSVFYVGNSAMHVIQVNQPNVKDPLVVKLQLTGHQYKRLKKYIRGSFLRERSQCMMVEQHPYGDRNFFFESVHDYGMFYTCNSWTNDGLKASGQKAVVWAVFKDGIFAQYGR